MSQQPSTVSDRTTKANLLPVFPCLPIASSHTVGWDKIQLAQYRQPPLTLPEHCSPYHTICINVGSVVKLEHWIEGHLETTHSILGDVGLYPANYKQAVSWDSEVDFLQIYLETAFLTLINYELWGSNCLELVPKLTFDDPLIQQIGLALKSSLDDGLGSRLYAESMANALAVHLISRYSTKNPIVRHYIGGLSQQQLKQVIDYINAHLDKNLSLVELADVVQLSSYHFARSFKKSTGISPHQYHLQCRIERAKHLLSRMGISLAEIAQIVGFASQGHFNYHFKRLVGMTPREYTKNHD
jgi:AraC family transcriptional regulator